MMMETMAFRNLSSGVSDLGAPKFIRISQTRKYAKPEVFRLPKQQKMRKTVVVNVQNAPKLVNGFSKPKGKELIEKAWGNETVFKDVSGLAEDGFNRAGRLIEGRMVYREKFFIRSYEVGADMTGSIETVFNLLQESAVNHAYVGGVCRDGFGSTQEMARLNLIWVVTRMQVQVDRYPCWGNVVEIDTWIDSAGKNSMRRDWLVRDSESGCIIARATSTWVMMNKETRKLTKFPEAVKKEISPYYLERSAIAQTDVKKLEKIAEGSAQHVLSGLTPKWRDLDTNCHVNNVKYVGWILESVPVYILESNELASITLEFRRECGQTHVIQSLTSVDNDEASSCSTSAPGVSYCSEGKKNKKKCLKALHLLRMEDTRIELVRGQTEWRSKTRIVIN